MSGIDNFHERRKQFITHLLSRFGDNSYNFSFDKFNYYHTKEEHNTNELNRSLNILENYDWLSVNKARSFDHTSVYWSDNNVKTEFTYPNLSTLEYRIRMRTGIQVDSVEKIGTNLMSKVDFKGVLPKTSLNAIASSFSDVEMFYLEDQFKGLWIKESQFNTESDASLIQDISINEEVFKRGIWKDNMKIVKNPSQDEDSFLLVFKKKIEAFDIIKTDLNINFQAKLDSILKENKTQEVVEVLLKSNDKAIYCFQFERKGNANFDLKPSSIWKVLGSYAHEDLAFRTAFSLKNNLIKWNKSSEGFYLLDHILLRPINKDVFVNILLNDPNSDWSFRLSSAYGIHDVERGIRSDVKKMRAMPFKLTKHNGKYIINWKEHNKLIGRCNQKYESEIEAGKKAIEIQAYFNKFSDLDIHDPSRVKFKREIEEVHPLHHYSFTLTIFLTKWTARFSDPEFQYLLESVFRKNVPAHIGIHFKWLELNEMVAFEEIYSLWLDENRKTDINYDILNSISDNLLSFAKVI